ncbi:serine O-acetyltransferase [Formosa agariphila KMM 3901]|uniref:Serine O-acetyltransferase n=1 Tax=Formosa agariphila (strain DSM 15362 / KCTC 12365 / LMG 23005 / KMM 3901 / M-2Alg 35-1) TaxID=1347342 RepID=T2KNF0_FORAG|nr:serine acetyltransferase [Formosa agariphila]CDF79993.1 serine O-acetyltransferase [Formosa agariphila KMM 3901]
MITSKKLYNLYLIADKKALNISSNSITDKLKNSLFPSPNWKFQKLLRKLEYHNNCKNKGVYKIYYIYLKYKYRNLSQKLGFSIPINVFGPGLSIVHYGTIVVNSAAKVGKNCRIHVCTNIGASGGSSKAPQIGDNVYIAPGAKIYGDITIANNTAIGANAVVNKSFIEENMMIAGNPAKAIKKIDINRVIQYIDTN